MGQVLKPDGSIRLCGDYKITTNHVLEIDKQPLTTEDLFPQLQGQKFSKLYLSYACVPASFTRRVQPICCNQYT